MQAIVAFAAHAIRAARLLIRDGRIPRPLRGLVLVGALPVPGPLDEAVLLLAAALLYAFYRQPMREAWALAAARRWQRPDSLPASHRLLEARVLAAGEQGGRVRAPL